jgi:inosine-uridine nucleoside N-ribohydrolase
MNRRKIILDVDTANGMPVRDIDDGLAIALALASPELELVGCTTCGGNCSTEESTHNTLLWLQMAGRQDLPVSEGRREPLIQDVSANSQFWDARSDQLATLWADMPSYPDPTGQKSTLKAHEFIIQMVEKEPGQITIIKAGALTNLALALLVEPSIASHVAAVIHMGGSPPAAQAPTWYLPSASMWERFLRMNTEYDPEATEIVIRSGIPFTFIPSEVTTRVFLRPDDVERIAAVGSAYHQYIAETSRPWVRFDTEFRGRPGSFMHDPLTVAAAIDESLFRFVDMHCDLERFRNRDYPYLRIGPQTPQVRVAVDVDTDKFEALLVDRLSNEPVCASPG